MSDEISWVLRLVVLLQFKHLLADFMLQNAYILNNRSKWGHPGGILHAAIHVVGSLIVLAVMAVPAQYIVRLLIFEGFVHYHIDWIKDNVGKRYDLTPDNRSFWVLTGLDQYMHQLTYVAMIIYCVS
ncbi:DUF3307 domain-containing protein [Defluviimonas sp. WL0050]|uniref:DUF3307 domain-containing protein n=1 Tax=Albidovulum litorale TaxID=2984134 RepID=A0ABT2ZHS3_9RHOB|nr:DUF3307 domain-containing protein [Defluviimonas sp. WL0050]MCV2870684.1 DUF3307 domain-containing protein [Defluviimonas sp. WL0050]